jgi:hypothetical protein
MSHFANTDSVFFLLVFCYSTNFISTRYAPIKCQWLQSHETLHKSNKDIILNIILKKTTSTCTLME